MKKEAIKITLILIVMVVLTMQFYETRAEMYNILEMDRLYIEVDQHGNEVFKLNINPEYSITERTILADEYVNKEIFIGFASKLIELNLLVAGIFLCLAFLGQEFAHVQWGNTLIRVVSRKNE